VLLYFLPAFLGREDGKLTRRIPGNYFASQGCISVLATYRLLPTAVYPDGAEDVTAALSWLVQNIGAYGGHNSRIFPIGQSAGGAHLATALHTGLLKEQLKNVGGFIFQSVPFWYNLKLDRRRKNMLLYHQTEVEEAVVEKMSVTTFAKCEREEVQNWPPALTMVGEYDPDEIVEGNMQFLAAYEQKMQRLPLLEVLDGHNHISYALGIGLEGDLVGPRILAFVLGH
jgi:acetyl esterase/lipase